MSASTRRVVVVGGGIAGLAAARALAGRCAVTLVERAPAAGGKLVTTMFRGRPLDLGPDNFISRNPAALRLCEELGLGDELLAPATSSAAVFSRGRARPLPSGLVLGVPTDLAALRRSGIVSRSATLRAAADLVLPRSRASRALANPQVDGNGDPTVAEVIASRLGSAVLDALVDPLIGGINAGDARQLSFAAAAPSLVPAATGRSLMLGLRARQPVGPAAPGPPLFLGLTGGIASLPIRLTEQCRARGVEVRLGVSVERLERRTGAAGWLVGWGDDALEADGVVLALPAGPASALLAAEAPELAERCAAIPYSGVVTVTFAWPDAVVAGLPGSGVLVPRSSGRLVTAATFTSTKWPRSANAGEVVVRASAGRHGDDRALRLDDAELVQRVGEELGILLGITDPPLEHVVQRWPASFPQYLSGHLARAATIHALAGALPALALAGAAYDGIGIPACVASGERAAAAVADQLAG